LYHVTFLRDACNLTSIPRKRSALWRAGVRNLQFYAVEKEIPDAGTTFPFSNPGLEELSLDPQACCPPYIWPVSTERFVDYVLGNVNKLCAAFEMISITSPREGPTLWYGEGRRTRGLGFEVTMAQAGYAWFLPIIDWVRFEFRDGI
ncbi:hypothetical protein OIDMADRAFT_68218, partial [Oidiodendron maius Zn]